MQSLAQDFTPFFKFRSKVGALSRGNLYSSS